MAVDPRHSTLVTKARAAAAQLMEAQQTLEGVIKEYASVQGGTWLDPYWAEGLEKTIVTEDEFVAIGTASAAITAVLDQDLGGGATHRRALNRAKG